MKMNFLISIVCALLLGYLCANFIFQEYKESNSMFSENNLIYFLQYGVYTNSDFDDIKADKYVKVENDGKYYVYVGMTTDIDNAKKIQDFYRKKNIDLYIKQDVISNSEFIMQLSQYDILLNSTKTEAEINSVLATILSSYEDLLLKR